MMQSVENSLFSDSVVEAIESHHPKTLWVAFSGGVDSHTLLVETVNIFSDQYPIKAVHVNHQLQAQAHQWQKHCQQVCDSLNVPMVAKVVTVSKGASLEAQARSARYLAFSQILNAGDVLLLGHHQDDAAETLIFRLLRGTGFKGLSGIAVKRELKLADPPGRAWLVRPFLTVSKQDILKKAKQLHLDWVEDPSNEDTQPDRNFLRKDVLPLLQQRWPESKKTLASTARLLQEQRQFFDELLQRYLNEIVVEYQMPAGNYVCLPTPIVSALSLVRFHEVLRCWLDQQNIAIPSTKAIEQLFNQLKQQEQVRVEWRGGALYQYKQLLFAEPGSVAEVEVDGLPVELDCWQSFNGFRCFLGKTPQKQSLPLLVPKDKLADLEWNARTAGLRCHPEGRGHSQSLKKVMQESAVLPWLRNSWPLLMLPSPGDNHTADEVVAMPGYFINKPFAKTQEMDGEQVLYLTISRC